MPAAFRVSAGERCPLLLHHPSTCVDLAGVSESARHELCSMFCGKPAGASAPASVPTKLSQRNSPATAGARSPVEATPRREKNPAGAWG